MEKKETPQQRYARKHERTFILHCFRPTEQDIISRLEAQENKSGYIKRLIREDIKKRQEGSSADDI